MASSQTPRLLALGFAGLGVATALAGCSAATADGGSDVGNGGGEVDTSAEYADGTYTADGSYNAPSGEESITVEITLVDDVVTDVVVTPHATEGNQAQFQGQFASGIAAEVKGKDIDTLNVSRVGGSSLTSGGFNQALEAIKADALA
ncbi:hypothetical protein [Pseudolysinimonas yzui]|uniref:FMN-binding protein n=1 Tax=Pseudolysinimonas yzui TaxID=2708254 RepID=A0A8J3GR86_9MICO|nr:hypothetical protein [Pseudolysinimonas yzui]GHF20064.1 hypothetical protein GCM10011600_21210 [Pseudolysinimonas yzui]